MSPREENERVSHFHHYGQWWIAGDILTRMMPHRPKGVAQKSAGSWIAGKLGTAEERQAVLVGGEVWYGIPLRNGSPSVMYLRAQAEEPRKVFGMATPEELDRELDNAVLIDDQAVDSLADVLGGDVPRADLERRIRLAATSKNGKKVQGEGIVAIRLPYSGDPLFAIASNGDGPLYVYDIGAGSQLPGYGFPQ